MCINASCDEASFQNAEIMVPCEIARRRKVGGVQTFSPKSEKPKKKKTPQTNKQQN